MTTPYIRSALRSEEKVGVLNADDLGVTPSLFETGEEDEAPLQSSIGDDDELLLQVQRLLEDGFGGSYSPGRPARARAGTRRRSRPR